MSAQLRGTERYDAAGHDVSGFSCGNELLDRWLIRYAGQNERRDAARTFVATTDGRSVYSYYTLVAGQVEHNEATPETSKGLSRQFPIPVAILARLAVDSSQQGHGIGVALLNDALIRVYASEQVAVRAVVVHAVDENAVSFYERFGFLALSTAPRTLMITLAALRSAGHACHRAAFWLGRPVMRVPPAQSPGAARARARPATAGRAGAAATSSSGRTETRQPGRTALG